MSRSQNPHTPKTNPTPLTGASSSIPVEAKSQIIKAAIEEKKEALVDLASKKNFSFDRASHALDLLALIAARLPERPRQRFVTQVALPLITQEPLDLLKICLSSPMLQSIKRNSEGPPTLLVEYPIRKLSDEIANGSVVQWTVSEILPLRSHAIAYRSSETARPYRKLIDTTIRATAEILEAHPVVQEGRCNALMSTPSFNVERGSSAEQQTGGRHSQGVLTLVVNPTTRPFDLATTLFREDQRNFFDHIHGLCQPKEVVPDSYRQRGLGYKVPLVGYEAAYPSVLLKEFHATTKTILFQIEALHAGLVPQNEVAAIKSRVRREVIEARHAGNVLEECVRRKDFNTPGLILFAECQQILSSCDDGQRTSGK